jgi:hypothetical protein
MSSASETDQAVQLAQQAIEKAQSGQLSDAARLLRQATTIAPEHALVKQAWLTLRQEEEKSELLGVCKDWAKSKDDQNGDKALKLIKTNGLGAKEAEQAMEILYEIKGEDDLVDQVTGELLQHGGAQRWLAGFVKEHPTQAYYELFERGDDSIDGLLKVLLNRAVWESDEAFVQGHRDCFMLSLAMMMEEALEHPERAMKGVAQLLAHHAQDLHGIIDADSFDVILTSLDIRLPNSLRSQATLATIKLFELAPSTAQDLISKFVISRVQKSIADELVVAFSAAAAIFPITVKAAAELFLSEGFISTLVPLVEGKNSTKLEQAALELISAACIDKNCRDAINRHCRTWLEDHVANCPDKKRANLAALVLVKLGEEQSSSEGPVIVTPGKVDQEDLIASFKSMVISSDTSGKQDSIEGLAYASLQPKIREDLSKSPKFLKRLIDSMRDAATSPNILFGGLTIFVNLTAYPLVQSEEEKRMAQLKAYANVEKPSVSDPLLDEPHTTVRCKRVLEAGVVPLLVFIAKKATPTALSHITSILLSLSHDAKSRPTLAQQGAIKLLVQIYDTITSSPTTEKFSPNASSQAAQALSKILISTNPTHIFTTAFPSHSVLRPLRSLLSQTEASMWQLHAFESLLALTNLASMDQTTQDAIIRAAFDTVVDDLLLSQNKMLTRASTELLCNLMASPVCAEKFADGTPRAGKRLHLLCALTDVEDAPTRSAAGGALAMLLSIDLAVVELLKLDKGVDFLLGKWLCLQNCLGHEF